MANKEDANKRRNKAAQKKEQKRKTKAATLRKQANVQVVHRPGISEMGAPDGFRAIGMAQAMMEYIKPLDEYYGKEPRGIDDLNKRMKLSMLLWNHALEVERSFINNGLPTGASRSSTAGCPDVFTSTSILSMDMGTITS